MSATPKSYGSTVYPKTSITRLRRLFLLGALIVSGLLVPSATSVQRAGAAQKQSQVQIHRPTSSNPCPWVARSIRHLATPGALAAEVLAKMTLSQKASFVILATYPPLESRNVGVASLCIPALSFSDGPNGMANGLVGVTQFPAPIAIAASFNGALARSVAQAVATEARSKGIAVVQAPVLNLARVPMSGRNFETFGEDPFLTSVMGVASVEGIQSTGDIANAKHFTAYTQETARVRLNQIVTRRALDELYNVPFKAVVQQAHVASIMCSYGFLNGVNICSDPYLYSTLKSWGFTGFVRSDLEAVANMAQAFKAGIAMIKPASPETLTRLVKSGALPLRDVNRAAASILRAMFTSGLIARAPSGSLLASVTTPSHASVALRAAENSIVLLKNSASVLPLSKKVSSIALIGSAAGQSPLSTGGGSSMVTPSFVVTPLRALRSLLGDRVKVNYQPGGPPSVHYGALTNAKIISDNALTFTSPLQRVSELGKGERVNDRDPNVTPAVATATKPANAEGWDKWGFSVRARRTRSYEISFQQIGDTWLYLNGHQIAASPGLHIGTHLTSFVHLIAGKRYTFSLKWYQVNNHPEPTFSMIDVTREIRVAVDAARKANVAIVFAGDYNTEAADRSSLSLPGDANALISAVAAVNPHTIVVLNTGGAVVMPWLSHVAGVIEAWYPGEMDGAAIAAVLSGTVNPSGRLPISFPVNSSRMPTTSVQQFPGVNETVNFGAGLDMGYRWYQLHHVAPLFPFGYGLSYTTFKLSKAILTKNAYGVTVRFTLSNTGHRSGADVVQAYVQFPSAAGEPPHQLRAFARVDLQHATSRRVVLVIPWSGFTIARHGEFLRPAGAYGIDLGQSSANFLVHLSLSV